MEVCRMFNNFVYFLVKIPLKNMPQMNPSTLLQIISLWASRVCLLVFVTIISIIAYVVLFRILPSEYSSCYNVPYFIFRVFLGVYIFYSIIFHYYKCRTLQPVKNPGTARDKFCIPCDNWKGPATSHCAACGRCIYRLDHHCPHIGQCVGAHNQSHFFLFLFHLLVGTASLFVLAPTFWLEWIELRDAVEKIPSDQCWKPYCFNRLLYMVVVSHGKNDNMVKLSFFFSVVIHCIMWGFICCYAFMISFGITFAMKLFGKSDVHSRKPLNWLTLQYRWKKYMNCQEQPIWKVFLIPMSRRIVEYDEYQEIIM